MLRSKISSFGLFAGIAITIAIVFFSLQTATVSTPTDVDVNGEKFEQKMPVPIYNQEVATDAITPEMAVSASTKIIAETTTGTITTYYSSLREGFIGYYGGRQIDNPADNLFVIAIDRSLNSSDQVWLQYELIGTDASGVAHSINDRLATGGYLIHLSDSLTLQREQLNPLWLVKGNNRILFSLPEGANYGYKIANLALVVEKGVKNNSSAKQLVITSTNESYGGKTYIRGYVVKHTKTTVSIANVEVPLNDGEFEAVIDVPDNNSVTIAASDAFGVTTEKNLFFDCDLSLDREYAWNENEVKTVAKTVQKGIQDSLQTSSAMLKLKPDALLFTTHLSITGLRTVDMPALDMGMINVTDEHQGYRFLPHGEHFTEGATVALKYDRTKIPSGYTENDIHTYYFDNNTRHWVALKRDTIDRQLCMVVSHTTHFTDMINGIIQTPESPETQGFAPTMMTDIKAADPTSKIELIAPPTANNRGTAGLSYPFEMPPARNGMQPQLGLQYNSDGGNEGCGEGWIINIPSISIDTRPGVPRYNNNWETETYMMDGEMLVTMDDNGQPSVAHRGEKIARKSDRQFYPRSEGAFSRIIRRGSNPNNYTWEVTDKKGTVYYYGGEGAVLRGTATSIINGHAETKDVIVRWMLKRVEELHGDYIEYNYDTVNEPIAGTLTAKAIYLSSVKNGYSNNAGSKGLGPHTVVTFTYGNNKTKQTNNARYGFLTSSNKLLEKVTVFFDGKILRSYGLAYKQGVFLTDWLDKLTHYDDSNIAVASHYFDYYDDAQSTKFGASENWNMQNDNIDGFFVNPLSHTNLSPYFNSDMTVLGGTQTTGVGFSAYAGVGLIGDMATRGLSAGASFGYSHSTSNGVINFVDINGDGLPDKVMVMGGQLYYRPNITKLTDTVAKFGVRTLINGVNSFSASKSDSYSYGGKLYAGAYGAVGVVGVDAQNSTSTTSVYFADVNNDGLIDIINNGKVYFNHINIGVPTFTLSSSNTPSPIMGGGILDTSDTQVDSQEQDSVVKYSPMLDVVRVWEAPYSGLVNISSNVQLQLPTGNYDTLAYGKADGVRVAIQTLGNELWNRQIEKGNDTIYNASVNNILITKGQRIYFRVQSGNQEMSNGDFDQVTWNPTITYTNRINRINPDGENTAIFNASEGIVINAPQQNRINSVTPIQVYGSFIKPITSDSIFLKIIASNDAVDASGNINPGYQQEEVYSLSFGCNDTFNGNIPPFTINNSFGGMNYEMQVISKTNVAWNNVKWNPYVQYTTTDGVFLDQAAYVSYSLYALQVQEGEDYYVPIDTLLSVKPFITWTQNIIPLAPPLPPATGKITVAVKTITGLLAQKEYSFDDGIMILDSTAIDSILVPQGALWIEYYSNDDTLLSRIDTAQAQVVFIAGDTMLMSATVFTQRPPDGFGPMYRGWGQFVYNGAQGRYANPINESLLELPQSENDNVDILTTAFLPMTPDGTTKSFWMGATNAIRINGDTISTARLGIQDVVLTNPFENIAGSIIIDSNCMTGTNASAPNLITKSNSTDVMAGLVGFTINTATGTSRTITAFLDMNGDGYPDWISENQIQLSNTRGGRDGEIVKGIRNQHSENSCLSGGYGGNPVHSFSDISQLYNAKNDQERRNIAAENAQQNRMSVSLSTASNQDDGQHSFIDINGDGLPDMVSLGNHTVRFNLGYCFTDPVSYNFDIIEGGSSTSINVGLGFDFGASSIQAGYGNTLTTSNAEYSLMDINSDGLPDKVTVANNQLLVYLNKGNGIDATPLVWQGAGNINVSNSIAESANASYTCNIPIPIPFAPFKISIGAGGSVNNSISKVNIALRDVDGDGFLDIVSSNNDASMVVRRSTIARTNKLKTVYNPMGGSFTLDYKHTQPSYEHPSGKWVLASVDVNHAIPEQGANMRTEFDYAEGKYDRHEREFFGFETVITKNVDTENNNALYRSTTQTFDVSNYYTKGNLLNTVVKDANNRKFTQSENVYYHYNVTASGDSYSFGTPLNACHEHFDRAISFTPLKYTNTIVYEGQPDSLIVEASYYEYYLNNMHYGELKTYRFSDRGTLASTGIGSYNYKTDVSYTGNSSKHISGLPTEVSVTGGDGILYRKVTAEYDSNYANHLTKITRQLDNSGTLTAVTDFKYNNTGNILKKTLPQNGKNERVTYDYGYEADYNMYVISIDENKNPDIQNPNEDYYHYRSTVDLYNYNYGIPARVIDINGKESTTVLDNIGRVKYITAPNELEKRLDYTIKFEYFTPSNTSGGTFKPWYALTTHYDPQDSSRVGIETVTFADGVGRPVQVKKTGVIDDKEGMIVSGFVKYDPYGRAHEASYPVFEENLNDKFILNRTPDIITPTTTTYDILDRSRITTLPDGSLTKMDYSLDNVGYVMVSTVTDAEGGKQETFTNGSQLTLKTVQYGGPNGEITTKFDYDDITQLLMVTDHGGNKTKSTYDMGGRRTMVKHPVSGITMFTYDNVGNLTSKTTANGEHINYGYDFNRLVSIEYPEYPINNVKYTYGGSSATLERKARIALQEDATGAQEFTYGAQGELTKVRRTVIVPNQAVVTYDMEWQYDSWNRLRYMTYPDGEKVHYHYNKAGLLDSVWSDGGIPNMYDYVSKIGYDKFEQRVYMKYGNGAETHYTYDNLRRRLSNLTVNVTPPLGTLTQLMNNNYTYDKVDNVLSVSNIAPLPLETDGLGGQMTHKYTYDGLYRLTEAEGNYIGADAKTAAYKLNMAYDNLHNITQKKQHIEQTNVQFAGTLQAGYDLNYNYDNNPFQISTLNDENYRTDSAQIPAVKNLRQHSYDNNGNLIYVVTEMLTANTDTVTKVGERTLRWDSENRLRTINNNGSISHYIYDASGERVIKISGDDQEIFVNGVLSGGSTSLDKFTAYINPYMVVTQGWKYTKHIYMGSQRIVSKLGVNSEPQTLGKKAGDEVEETKGVDYRTKYEDLRTQIKDIYTDFDVPYYGTDNNYVEAVESTDSNDSEKLKYYYHSDHLGSSSLITDMDGNTVQHLEYVPFGEVFLDERNNTWNTPYLFNAKELDEETGLYYYGARYYDPRASVWLSADPMQEKYPNVSTYAYCANNPIKFIDPDGKDWVEKDYNLAQKIFKFFGFDVGNKKIEWNNNVHSQKDISEKSSDRYLGKTVAVIEGSRNEKLGKDNNLFGEGAILAKAKVYGPKGADDIKEYDAFTMTSDFEAFGAIDNREYTVNYRNPGKNGKLKSNWAVNNTNPVDCLDGKNPSPISPYSKTQKNGIYIHSSNKNGFAGKYSGGAISTGCLLIVPSNYDKGGKSLNNGWDQFNTQLDGVKEFKLILNRK